MPTVATVDGDLLRPTLGAHRPRDWSSRLPWRASSEVYVGLLGGPVAVTIIAALNARRLRMSRRSAWLMVLIGGVGMLAAALAATLGAGDTARQSVQLAGVLTTGPLYLLQRSPDRVHATFSPHADGREDYASLVRPGIAAILAGIVVEGGIVAALEQLT